MSDQPAARPVLTARSAARIKAGRTEGAGTDVCIKCVGPKEVSRVNSDKCKACNNPRNTSPRPSVVDGKRVNRARVMQVRVDEPMFQALVEQADKRGQTIDEYVNTGLARVLKKDAGWTPDHKPANLTD